MVQLAWKVVRTTYVSWDAREVGDAADVVFRMIRMMMAEVCVGSGWWCELSVVYRLETSMWNTLYAY